MSRRSVVVYVSGPYTADTPEETEENIARARAVAARLWTLGFTAICPHANTARFEVIAPHVRPEDYYAGDCEILCRCDALLMVVPWERFRLSAGSMIEWQCALEHGVPVFEDVASLRKAFPEGEDAA